MRGLEELLNELESFQLQTVLIPSKRSDRREWDYVRVNLCENPRWYRSHCSNHPSSRGIRRGKPDTRIRRQDTLSALRGLIAGTYRGKYADDLLRIARKKAA